MSLSNNAIYRVSFCKDTESVKIVCIGMECLDTSVSGDYISFTKTPNWIQRKVATLSMLSWPSDPIEGLGERVDEYTYWVYDEQSVGH